MFDSVFDGDHPAPTEAVRERWRKAFLSNKSSFTVFDDGRVVGVSIVSPPWIHALHVLPERWGQGVGRALHDHAVDQIRAAGEPEALARVWADNHRARAFWEKQGWTALDWSERAQDPPHPEVLLYTKTLAAAPHAPGAKASFTIVSVLAA